MKIGIIGQGASGLVLAIMLKKKNISNEVIVFDKNQIPARKLYVTGNGRCNIGNTEINKYSYNQKIAFDLIKNFNAIEEIKFFKTLGISTRYLDNLIYPYSLSAKAFTDYLIKIAKELKVKFVNNVTIEDYIVKDNSIEVKVNDKQVILDRLVIAVGGKSHPVFGSDGNLFDTLKKHKYLIKTIKPGLAPIKVLENVKPIENERLKVNASLILDNDIEYKESGEVLFKKDSLSGICIFNISSIIARDPGFKKAIISLDLFPDIPESTLYKQFETNNKISKWNFLEGYFNTNVAEYIRKQSGAKNLMRFDSFDLKKIVKFVKNMSFTYKETYPFSDSQVSVGGVELKNINEKFESKIEKNVFLMGEVLDIDGLCGGYNLMLCFAEANEISKNI